MDAVEHLARLDDTPRPARLQGFQRIGAGPVDSRDADDGDRNAACRAQAKPGAFGIDAVAGARQRRRQRRGLVDPSSVMIAVDRDGGEIDDRGEARRRRNGVVHLRQHRIGAVIGGNRDEERVRVRDRARERRRCVPAVEYDHLDRAATVQRCGQRRRVILAAGGADNAIEPSAVKRNVMLRRVTEAQADQGGHAATSLSATAHSSRTAGSDSAGRYLAAKAANAWLETSRAAAHTAAPRTTPAGSSMRRSTQAAREGSPLLPMAISTLRT